MLLSLPVVRMMREHAEDKRRADTIVHEALQQQHDIARRVHVLEWLTLPPTKHTDGDHK